MLLLQLWTHQLIWEPFKTKLPIYPTSDRCQGDFTRFGSAGCHNIGRKWTNCSLCMRLLPSRIVYWLLVFMLGRLPSSYTVALRRISNVKKTIPFSSVSATESGLSANRERNQLRILNLKLSEKRSFPAKPAPAKVPRTMEDHAKVALPTNSNFPALGLCTDLVAALDAQGKCYDTLHCLISR